MKLSDVSERPALLQLSEDEFEEQFGLVTKPAPDFTLRTADGRLGCFNVWSSYVSACSVGKTMHGWTKLAKT